MTATSYLRAQGRGRTRQAWRWLSPGLKVLLVALACAVTAPAWGVTLPAPILAPNPLANSRLFGDFYVYSLAVLNESPLYGNAGAPNSGDPYYVPSSPGQISNLMVVGTGVNGGPITTNHVGADNAFETPTGVNGSPFFGTQTATEPKNGPGAADANSDGGANDGIGTWDAETAVLRSAVGTGNKLVIFYNLNDTGPNSLEGQDQLTWAKVTLIDTDTGALPKDFFLTNDKPTSQLLGGPEPDPSLDPIGTGDVELLRDSRWVYVAGKVTVSSTGFFLHEGGLIAGDPAGATEVNQNLGQNAAAFGVYNPELSDLIMNPSAYDVVRADYRMSRLDNGYEQLFVLGVQTDSPPVPEPATFVLSAIGGLLSLGLIAWRRRQLGRLERQLDDDTSIKRGGSYARLCNRHV